jgi:hypothetical protein
MYFTLEINAINITEILEYGISGLVFIGLLWAQ